MNCYLHPETEAVAYCRSCGRALCENCRRTFEGTVFCEEHLPVNAAGSGATSQAGAGQAGTWQTGAGQSFTGYNPYAQTTVPGGGTAPMQTPPFQTSPGLAFLLGCIPLGVGAIYNGQYLKGLVHALIFGLLVSLSAHSGGAGEPLAGILLAAFIFYMPFEAYHTARRRQLGVQVDEWSSILPGKGGQASIGPIILILIGVAFLLDSLHIIDFWAFERFWPVLWPVLLIVLGAYALYSRLTDRPAVPPAVPTDGPVAGVRHE